MKEFFEKKKDFVEERDGENIVIRKILGTVATENEADKQQKEKSEIAEREPRKLEEFSEISAEEAQDILKHLAVHGDNFDGKALTAEDLVGAGQEPKYIATIGGRKIFLAKQPYLFNDRPCMTVYVEGDDDNKFIPRTYYLSNSSASWRYLPEYTIDDFGQIDYYSKGYEEQSLNSPLAVQKKMASLSGEKDAASHPANADLIFAGTARYMDYTNRQDQSYYVNVESKPINVEGDFHLKDARDPYKTLYGSLPKQKPENIAFRHEEDEPDFSRMVDSWTQQSDLYGAVEIHVFESRDGENMYVFARDEAGRSWLVCGETTSEVGSNGLRKTWLNLGDLFTPAYEYISQTGGFGNIRLMKKKYTDMYANYLSKIPLIRKFEDAVKK